MRKSRFTESQIVAILKEGEVVCVSRLSSTSSRTEVGLPKAFPCRH